MHIGWVLVWTPSAAVSRYLHRTGFRLDYVANGAAVYRPAALSPARPSAPASPPPVKPFS